MSPRTLAALLLAAALAPAARAADLNVITSVDVKDEGSSVVLSVKGTKKPSFTTFSMAEPPRFVIDFSESRFDGVPETLQVGDGTVNVVKNLSYGSDASSIARVMIAFAVEVDPPDVSDVGDTLVVRVAKPGAAPVAAAPVDDGKARAEAAQAEAEQRARAEAEARARSEEEARLRFEREELARADEEARIRAQSEQKAREEQARAEREEKARAEREAQARAQAEAERQARAEAEEQARADAEAKARDEREARARAEGAEKRRAEEAAAEQAAAAAAERQEQERQAALEKAREDYDRQKAEAVATATPLPEAAVAAERPEPATTRLEAGAPSARLREVGFKQLAGVSRVFVRTSVTPRFTIQELGDGVIRLELENTRAERRNDLRFLDTSFFPSAVALVTPGRQGTSYVVDIKLRQRVPYQQRIEGDVLAIDFERPAQAQAASATSSAVDELLPAADEAPAAEAGTLP